MNRIIYLAGPITGLTYGESKGCMEEGNVHDHAMVNEVCGYRVSSLDAGIDVVNWMFSEDR